MDTKYNFRILHELLFGNPNANLGIIYQYLVYVAVL